MPRKNTMVVLNRVCGAIACLVVMFFLLQITCVKVGSFSGKPFANYLRAEGIELGIEAYTADYGFPPANDKGLSSVLSGQNPKGRVYVNVEFIRTNVIFCPTNEFGYFVDFDRKPLKITMTTDSVTVVTLDGKSNVSGSLRKPRSMVFGNGNIPTNYWRSPLYPAN
jgi:hypothetical protein